MTFIETLAQWGLIPNPIHILTEIAKMLQSTGLFNLFRMLAIPIFLGLVGYRLLVATAQLRAQVFLSLMLRGVLVAALLAASPYLQASVINLFSGGMAAGLRVGGTIFDYNASMTTQFNDMVAFGALVTGAGTLVALSRAAVKAGERATAEVAKKEGAATALGQTATSSTAQVAGKALDYLNAFALLFIPLFLLLTVILVTSGVTVMIGTMLMPVLLVFLVLNGPGVTAQFLQPMYRAFIGSFLLAVLVPIVFGIAMLIAVGVPMADFGRLWEQHWTALSQTAFYDLGGIARNVGALIWTIIRTIAQVIVGVILAYYVVNKAVETVLHFIGGIGGLVKSWVEMAWTGRMGQILLAQGARSAAIQTAAAGVIGSYRLARWGAQTAAATAQTAYTDLQASGRLASLGVAPPPPNAYDTTTRRPIFTREWNRDSLWDRAVQKRLKEKEQSLGYRRIEPPIIADKPEDKEIRQPPQLPPPPSENKR